MKRTLLLAVCLVVPIVFMPANAWAVQYQIRNIDSVIPPGAMMIMDMNDGGQIAGGTGNINLLSSTSKAFVSQEGAPTQYIDTTVNKSWAYALNNNGQAAGMYYTYAAPPASWGPAHAFVWQAGSTTLRDLGTLGGADSFAHDINSGGQVVGVSCTSGSVATGTPKAFLWQDGSSMRDIGHLGGGSSSANAINDNGQVAGWSRNDSGEMHAFLWQDGAPMQDIGSLGGMTIAAAINSAGRVVGYDTTMGRAFFWQSGSPMLDIGTLGGRKSVAEAINDNGIVVGYSSFSTSAYFHAFTWQLGSGMQDLGTLGGNDSFAIGINSSGQIIGGAADVNGIFHTVLWEPIVPEPSSILAIFTGFGGIVAIAWRRKKG
ncbi:MAG: PEP-CTERM sorting domain-containing protein [Armatimonadota bacterium]